ncbi:MAG: NINE protein [Phycisphaerae bacterium]
MRSVGVAYLLWLFFGVMGAHRFYCGRVGTGILWALTGGLACIGWIVDAFLIPNMVDEANREFRSYQRSRGAYGGALPLGPAYAPADAPLATPLPPEQQVSGVAAGYRVVFCTNCGSPMQVPGDVVGAAFACPACHTVLNVPA